MFIAISDLSPGYPDTLVWLDHKHIRQEDGHAPRLANETDSPTSQRARRLPLLGAPSLSRINDRAC